MGFLSGITKSLFGGTDDTGIKEQQKSNDRSQAYIREQTGLARGDAGNLYQQGDYARNLGINLAMALMGQSLPTQMNMLQQGNVAAQNQYIQGQPMYMNDILGVRNNQPQQTAYSQTLPSASSYQMTLPSFNQAWGLGGSQPQNPQGSSQSAINQALSQMLGGAF